MSTRKSNDSEYAKWLGGLKKIIKHSQVKAILSVNKEIIMLYWNIGKELYQKQVNQGWGNSIVDNLEKDLMTEFPDLKGFSRRNLFYMKGFYTFYKSDFEKVQQLVAQIPWGHNILIVSKSKTVNESIFYLKETVENNWSRSVLDMQIGTELFLRQGNASTNFSKTLSSQTSSLANYTLKDPYLFDFLSLNKNASEKSIENQLTKHITKFLLELGTGFAFIGKQHKLEVGDKDYYIDLLFYHTKLRCYVVVELKAKSFKPEYAGKLSFYLSAVDDIIKTDADNPTIGIVLCQKKNKIEVEYALRGISQPIGVAEFQLSRAIPEEIKSDLPTIEEIEKELAISLHNYE